ncbi:MAG: EamA family transporter [Pseudomonadota bacterium]
MSAWLISLEGTDAGRTLALCLALLAAVLHAVFGAMQKGRVDPWTTRASIDVSYGLMALPFALFVVPWPEPHMWPIFAGVVVIHLGYKYAQASAYAAGGYTVVYPVVRGLGPFFTVIAAGFFFGETFTGAQWAGVATLMAGIFGLAVYNLIFQDIQRDTLPRALTFAVITGAFVALYTTYDAYGIRSTADPFTFLAWFFLVDSFTMPLLRWLAPPAGARPAPLRDMIRVGVPGALVAIFSFGSILLATRLDKVGEAAVLRETSVVFAALIGWVFLGEKAGPRRLALMGLIGAGAVIVELGG